MKKISDYIKSVGFIFSFRRLKRAIILVILFIVIGIGVWFSYNYKNSDSWKERVYTREISSKYDIGDKTIIKILKEDVTSDDKLDYLFITGNEVYSTDSDSNKTLEQYDNINLVLFDGNTNSSVEYETKKSFSSDVDLKIYKDEENIYFLVSDTSGNVSLCKAKESRNENQEDTLSLVDIIANTSSNFLGYTIYQQKQDESKIKVTLDNYDKSYLDDYNEETVLDFSQNGIDISRYRETYLRDCFSSFDLKDTNGDGILEFVGYQHLLYCLDDTGNKTLGIVKTIFTIQEDNKLKFDDVEISIF